ncbi:hypothetical protein SISSUDRAFT_1051924 [Sistotremastrum suecicum HHB10207 ss-3]|uniref:F-box domain-containing protein n=1 Tax=Sistotremastrum suecicum HHB10207 ss-3 TaxID=1314776 RepID=A0A166A906_9AGAM|nr:hypothetical protein SISSUDRAFT_1051924 [Sistotremastrum suecicum HHB10207 ss-3]
MPVSRIPTVSELSGFCGTFESNVSDAIQEQLINFSSCSSGTLSSTRQTLLELEQRLAQSSQFLKERHNMCTPIGRLPDELIQDILARCVRDHFFGRYSFMAMSFPAVFFLCVRWREIAIHSPDLWADIPLPLPSAIFNLFFGRSQDLPLSIYVDIEYMSSSKEALDSLASSLRQIIPRVSSLRVAWNPRYVEKSLNIFLSEQFGDSEFTHLTCFKIESYELLDEAIVSLNMPRLEILDYGGHIDSFPKFIDTSTIIKLSLDGTDANADAYLDLLYDFPCLESLIMGSSDEPITRFHDVVRLERLKMLSMNESRVDQVDYIIRHLEVPPSAHMRIDTWELDSSVSLQDFIGPYILQSHEYSIEPTRPAGSSHPFFHSLSSKSIFDMYIGFQPKRPEIIPLTALAPYFINLSVIKLHIQILPSVLGLIRTIAYWSNIVHLGVHTRENDFGRLLEAFRISSDLPCPLLESFDCTRTKFKAESMGQFLAMRKNRGVPIQNLTFTEGFASETERDAFGGLVDNVHEVALEG